MKDLRMLPSLPRELGPEILISGATPVNYPKSPGDEQAREEGPVGIRVGFIARDRADEAWRVAEERFPEDRKGQIAHVLTMKVSNSHWHKELSELGERTGDERSPCWLRPFENYKTFCPYLVGSYDRVAEELGRYLDLSFTTFILDIPPSEAELQHKSVAFERALEDAGTLEGPAS